MFRPPHDPQDRPLIETPTWRSVFVSYALMAVLPLLLWIVSQPVAGTVTVAGIASLLIAGKRAYRLNRCFYHCQKFTFNLFGKARITVTHIPDDGS